MTAPHEKSKTLEERHAREEKYHDEAYGDEESAPRHYDYHPTAIVFEGVKKRLGDLSGMRVLEYGCGGGWTTYELLRRGGVVTAFDISTSHRRAGRF
jgi:2-polyprenyl-3-methyl-5-hydroxy-6-metoxy-1,4-benzoquinol methylase